MNPETGALVEGGIADRTVSASSAMQKLQSRADTVLLSRRNSALIISRRYWRRQAAVYRIVSRSMSC